MEGEAEVGKWGQSWGIEGRMGEDMRGGTR